MSDPAKDAAAFGREIACCLAPTMDRVRVGTLRCGGGPKIVIDARSGVNDSTVENVCVFMEPETAVAFALEIMQRALSVRPELAVEMRRWKP